jgi:lipopolysaccharide transport system permease protein
MQALRTSLLKEPVATPPPVDELIIEPGQGIKHYWRELWRYRELFVFLAWRDITVRYKQTAIGVLWAVIRPLLTMFFMISYQTRAL